MTTISLKVRIDKSKHNVECSLADDIATVKARIEAATGEQVRKRRLIFMGKGLSDTDKVSGVGMKNGSVLMVTGCENDANATAATVPPPAPVHVNPAADVAPNQQPKEEDIDDELAAAIRMSNEDTTAADGGGDADDDMDPELAAAIKMSNEEPTPPEVALDPSKDELVELDFERFNSDNVVTGVDVIEEIKNYYSESNRYVDPQFPPLPKSLYLDPKDADSWKCATCSVRNPLPPVPEPPTSQEEAQLLIAKLEGIRCSSCSGKPTHVQKNNITNRPSTWLRPGTSCEGCEMIAQAQGLRDPSGVVSRNCTHYIRDDITNNTVGMEWKVIRQEPRPEDVLQGALANCWFGGALSCIAQRPALIDKLILTKEYNPVGAYLVQLHHSGTWRNILIDDTFPCVKTWEGRIENNGNTIYFSRGGTLCYAKARRHQLWVPLIEKASAKLFGSYGSLASGSLAEALQLTTGYACQGVQLQLSERQKERQEKIRQYRTQLLLEGKDPDEVLGDVEEDEVEDDDILWFKILSAKEAGFILGVGCACDPSKVTYYNEELGLQSPHAYGVLDVREVDYQGRIARLVQLRNPWGDNSPRTWKGNWGKTWSGWTRELKLELGVINKGGVKMYDEMSIFWMEFSDFRKHFVEISICRTHPLHWNRISETGWLPSELGPGQAFEVTAYKRTNVDLICWQEKHITRESALKGMTQNIDVGFAVVQLSNEEGNNAVRCIEFVNPSIQDQCSVETSLAGGYRYLIVPYSAAMLRAATVGKALRRVTLVIYSDNYVSSRKVDQTWTNVSTCLSRCIAQHCKRSRIREDGVFNCTTRSSGSGHLTCVIENSSSSPAVVQVDTNSSNCYTSRQNNSGECIAFLPPKTLAIVMSLAVGPMGTYSLQTALLAAESADFAEPATDIHQQVEFMTSSEIVTAVGEPCSKMLSFPDENPDLFQTAPEIEATVDEEEMTDELRLALEMSNEADDEKCEEPTGSKETLTEEEEIALALKLSMAEE